MEKKENYRYTEDGVLLVRKTESGRTGNFSSLFYDRELWFRCSEKDPDRQYLQMVLGGWFGLHKFMEGSFLQGLGYLLTCGCFGVFYLCDLFAILCGNYFYRKVTYVNVGPEVERSMQKIYYRPLEHKKRAFVLLPVAVGILVLAVWLIYLPVGKLLIGLLAMAASGQITTETAEWLWGLIG